MEIDFPWNITCKYMTESLKSRKYAVFVESEQYLTEYFSLMWYKTYLFNVGLSYQNLKEL